MNKLCILDPVKPLTKSLTAFSPRMPACSDSSAAAACESGGRGRVSVVGEGWLF